MTSSAHYLTGPQVRAELGISRATWLRGRRSGAVPAPADLPGALRWSRADIERFKQGGRRYFSAHRRALSVGHEPQSEGEQR